MTVLLSLALLVGCGRSADSDAAARPTDHSIPQLDAQQVPADLRHLVPLAQKWGIGDDVERLAKGERATTGERAELRQAVAPHQTRITEWLDSFGQGSMPQEAAAFMYMQLAIEEMSARP